MTGAPRSPSSWRFSEELAPDFSYTTVRDHAFTVAGGIGDLCAPAKPAQQYRVGGPRHARRQRGRQPVAPKHHRLLRPGSHLHRGRQEAVRRASAGRCGAEHPSHGRSQHHRHRQGGRDSDRRHHRHFRRRRSWATLSSPTSGWPPTPRSTGQPPAPTPWLTTTRARPSG